MRETRLDRLKGGLHGEVGMSDLGGDLFGYSSHIIRI